jgi:hypothetical protein
MARERTTTDRLRSDIDHGRTGDKVDFTDPATAPLGTDDEAAGSPPTREQIRHAEQQEIHRSPDDTAGRSARDMPSRQFGTGVRKPVLVWVVIAATAILALILLWALA